ncbi:MAG: hypothetical protein D6754_15885 [Alphaproteobacteria bacterium]|nr:MAG: hypothetical protein D6754_15885 [Alphaproteobacteria bacterium]
MDRRVFLSGLALAAPITLLVAPAAGAQQGFDLVTGTEFASRKERGPTRSLTQLKADGPQVRVYSPKGTKLTSPVDFDLEFVPRDGVPPMMGSIRLDYDMGLFWKDVTSRLMKYASVEGNRLRCRGARLPPGRHILRLRIIDKKRRTTVTRLEITVAG